MASGRDGAAIDEATHRSTWRWVLSRWPILGAGLLIGAALGALLGSRAPARFESTSVVVATMATIPAEEFEGVAEHVFPTDAVLQPVIDELGLDETPRSLLASRQLEGVPVSGSVAIEVTGRSSDPDLAEMLSDAAARSFARTVEERGIGTFEVFSSGAGTAGGALPLGLLFTAAGAFAGVVVVLTSLFLSSFVREPLMDERQARSLFRTEASFSVRARGGGRGTHALIHPAGAMTAIRRAVARSILRSEWGGPDATTAPMAWCVLVERHRRGDRGARAVSADLFLGDLVPGRVQPPILGYRAGATELEPLGGQPRIERDPAVVVCVVSERSSGRKLRTVDEATRAVGVPPDRRVLVFVRSGEGATRTGDLVVDPFERLALPPGTLEPEVPQAPAPPPMADASEVTRTEAEQEAVAPEPAPVAPEPAVDQRTRPDPALAPEGPRQPSAGHAPPPEPVLPPEPALLPEPTLPLQPPEQPRQPEDEGRDSRVDAEGSDVAALLADLQNPVADARLRALNFLLQNPEPQTLDAVRDRLRDPEPAVRGLAVSVLAAIQAARHGR